MNKEEILKALRVIKEVCMEHKPKCNDCPFYSRNNGCDCNIINDIPTNWDIQGNVGKWRAFYD